MGQMRWTLAVLLFAGSVGATAGANDKARIAVLPFAGAERASWESWWASDGAVAAQDLFVTELVKSGKLRVIERERLASLLEEQELSRLGAIDARTAVAAGKLLGVKYLLTGALTQYGTETIAGEAPAIGGLPSFGGSKSKFRATMNARIIDAETGEIVWVDEASGASGGFKLRVGGLGGGKERSPGAQFDAALRPIILQLCASIDGAEL